MKSLILLWSTVAKELHNRVGTDATRDISYLKSRCEHEGFSFLTITLPTFSQSLETGLSERRLRSDSFPSFKKDRRGSCLPAFLQGFTSRVFNGDGILLDEPDIESIYAIRQLSRLFSKIEKICSEDRQRRAFEQFIEIEQDVRSFERSFQPLLYDD